MPEEVKYTTRPDAPTHSSSRADVHESYLVIIDRPQESPENLQRASLLTGLPVAVIRDHEGPFIATEAKTRSEALGHVRRLGADTDAKLRIVDPSVRSLFAGLMIAFGLASMLAVSFALVLLFFELSQGLLLVAVLGAMAMAGLIFMQRRGHEKQDERELLREQDRTFRAAIAPASDVWQQLQAVRRSTLDPDLPPGAAADAWSALDELEASLMASPEIARDITMQLSELANILSDTEQDPGSPPSTTDAVAKLQRSMEAVRATRNELDRP